MIELLIILLVTLILIKIIEISWNVYDYRRFQHTIQEFRKEEEWLKAVKAQYDKWAEEGKV